MCENQALFPIQTLILHAVLTHPLNIIAANKDRKLQMKELL